MMKKRVGLIGAMNEEVVELKSEMKNITQKEIAGWKFFLGTLHGQDVVLVEGGIGKVNSSMCTTLLIQEFKVDMIIFTGVAGGIRKGMKVGDIVISKDLIEHDFDATAFGSEYGEIPRMDTSIFKGDERLIKLAHEGAKSVYTDDRITIGRILSGDEFVASKERVEWLRETFDGDCTEMEGAAVAHVAHLFKVPFVVIRAISDTADDEANHSFNEFVEVAAKNAKVIIVEILENL